MPEPGPVEHDAPAAMRLSELIRARRDELVAEWCERIRAMSPAQELSRPVLVDHMPEILARIADAVEPDAEAMGVRRAEAPRLHALDRLARGFDLEAVIHEYVVLRDCVLGRWEREVGDTIRVAEVRRLDAALDASITESTSSIARARERMLRDDVSAHERHEERLRFLSEASRQLGESIEYEQTLARIARLAVPAIADWFAVEMLRDGGLASIVVAHADPTKAALVERYQRQFRADPSEPHGVARVIREGQAELYDDVPDELLAAVAKSSAHLEILRELGMRSVMLVPLRVGGRTIGAITFVSSESGRRFDRNDLEAAQELADRAAMAIENARLFRAAEAAIRWREDVMAVVSHDLRSPLSSISMSAGLLFQHQPDPRTRKQLETILRAAGRMDRLIGDLLDTAGIQAGRLSVVRKIQPIAPILAEAIEAARPEAVAKGQTLASEVDVGDACGAVDRERILQLLANLLGNAKKFSPAGTTITVRADLIGDEVVARVIDHGAGIPDAHRAHVFDAYWSARREEKRGVGLGLFISKGIVEAHGGRIWIEAGPDGGAVLCFALPRA